MSKYTSEQVGRACIPLQQTPEFSKYGRHISVQQSVAQYIIEMLLDYAALLRECEAIAPRAFKHPDAEVEALHAALNEAKDGWHQDNGVADLAMKHRDAAENETKELKRDAERINWLALHPRGAKIVIAGAPQDCIFWGISSAPNNTLREAIDTAMREESK